VILGNLQIVIDTGQRADKFWNCYADHVPFWDRQLEALYISHRDKDHDGLVEEIKGKLKVGKLLTDASVNDLLRYRNLQIEVVSGAEAESGGRVLGANTDNTDSVVLRLSFGEFSGILTGDLDEKGELALLERGVIEKTSLIKVAHHGSKYSSSEKFLKELSPELAIISVGAKNSYGHPNSEVLIRLEGVGAKVLRTDTLGTIEVISDGHITGVLTKKK